MNPYETIAKSDAIYLDTSALIKINKDEWYSSKVQLWNKIKLI